MTSSRFSFGISRPITDLPGMTSTTRTLTTDNERARSLARLEIWLDFTPGAGSSSKRVMTGPGITETTSTWMPKSFSLSSTSRDIASSDSAEYPPSLGRGSSSKESGGSSPGCAASNSGTCLSCSARSLFSTCGITGSIRGFGRAAVRTFSARSVSCRSRCARRPAARSRSESNAARTRSHAEITDRPIRSMTASHDTPLNNDADANHSASSSSVEPRMPSMDWSVPPTSWPAMPPAVSRRPTPLKCNVAMPQLVSSVATKPSSRSENSALLSGAGFARSRKMSQPAKATITGNR